MAWEDGVLTETWPGALTEKWDGPCNICYLFQLSYVFTSWTDALEEWMADRCKLKVDRWVGVESEEADGLQVLFFAGTKSDWLVQARVAGGDCKTPLERRNWDEQVYRTLSKYTTP